MTAKTIQDLLAKAASLKSKSGELPGNACFADRDRVVCFDRTRGESRFPYIEDGLVLWLHSTGFINACESTFTIFNNTHFGEGPHVAFFGGVKCGDGFTPVSVTGAARQPVEDGIERYIIYSLKCAYCIADTKDVIFALRLAVDGNKHIRFTLSAVNKTDEEREIYLAHFMEALLRFAEAETYWQRMTKYGERLDNGNFILKSVNREENCLVIKRAFTGGRVTGETFTTARKAFLGASGLSLESARPLFSGKIEKEATKTSTTDLPVSAAVTRITLAPHGDVSEEFDLEICVGQDEAERIAHEALDASALDGEIARAESAEAAEYDKLKIEFEGWKDGLLDAVTFNRFLRKVQKQTSFCALGKNYGGMYLGIRDVFQQLEASLMWQKEKTRERMVYALNFVLSTGRPPRMFSFPKAGQEAIPLDLEKYIDQGVWIISTFYTYIAHTGDFSILDEECGYVDAPDTEWSDGHFTGERTTALEHLIRIMEYLISNIDREYTGCLRVLFGDWNDAVDGLGATEDEGREFGTGVTVMATLQFWQNLREMSEILSAVGGHDALIEKYKAIAEAIETGLDKYAIDREGDGRRIVHGWGDKVSYKVGSFRDTDGESRHSLTPNSFWAITGFIRRDVSLKREIVECVDAVASKYGLKTFDIPFTPASRGVGRIKNILPGTYENACAYAHCSLFGTMALFGLGESERAWSELVKTSVITHKNATLTSFVMPNSYCENEEFSIDGESLSDWHTGSGCVLIKEIVKYGFGVAPTLSGLLIQPPKCFPAKRGEMKLNVKGCELTVIYEDRGEGERKITLDAPHEASFDELMDIPTVFIANENIPEKLTITVTD